jgi:hypothetical protein
MDCKRLAGDNEKMNRIEELEKALRKIKRCAEADIRYKTIFYLTPESVIKVCDEVLVGPLPLDGWKRNRLNMEDI